MWFLFKLKNILDIKCGIYPILFGQLLNQTFVNG
jgi:hypothetical protein